MKIAKSKYDTGTIFGFAGGFLIGWPIGTAVTGGDPEWVLVGVGAGLILVSIPFSISYNKHAKSAVIRYNSIQSPEESNEVDLKFGFTNNGIRIRMIF